MPIYSYRCETCGHQQDVLQKMSDPLLTVCPSCGASTLRKQVTAAGFQLKGSGWYVTDFRNPASKEASKSSTSSEGDSSTAVVTPDKSSTTPDAPAKAAESTTAKTEAAPSKPIGPPASGTS